MGQVTVLQLIKWLEKRGFKVLRRDGCPTDIVPCAHLVGPDKPRDKWDFHWVYRDEDGDVHDPSLVSLAVAADDPTMKNLSLYARKELTLSVSSPQFAPCPGCLTYLKGQMVQLPPIRLVEHPNRLNESRVNNILLLLEPRRMFAGGGSNHVRCGFDLQYYSRAFVIKSSICKDRCNAEFWCP